MRAVAEKPAKRRWEVSVGAEAASARDGDQAREPDSQVDPSTRSIVRLQHTLGNQAIQRMLQTQTEGPQTGVATGDPAPTELAIRPSDDLYEREADQIAERVMRMPASQRRSRPGRSCVCNGECPKCKAKASAQGRVQTKRVHAGTADRIAAPPLVRRVLSAPGQPLDRTARDFMEPRFGRDLGHVRVHADAQAAESAAAINALAFTVGSHIVFGQGQYASATQAGRYLLAHELSHVEQQRDLSAESADGPAVVQRICRGGMPTGNAILSTDENDYKKAVQAGKYCRDSGATGTFHKGRCYREVPPSRHGFPSGDQVCFDEQTGQCIEDSPDVVSAVEGRNPDGTCNLSFTRSLGHAAEDVIPSEPGIVGAGFGALSGAAIGATLRPGGSSLLGTAIGFIGGTSLGAGLGLAGRPIARWLSGKGYVPVVGLSLGTAIPFPNLVAGAWQGRLSIGASNRDRPILDIFYPELKLQVMLVGESTDSGTGTRAAGPSTLTSLVAGVRIDPGEAGGHYLSFFGGSALSIEGGRTAIGREAGVALGYRWRWIGAYGSITHVRDAARAPGSDEYFTMNAGIELGPSKPQREDAKPLPGPGRGVLSRDVVERIQRALDERVANDALMAGELRNRLKEARKEADEAGPDEESFRLKALRQAQNEAANGSDAYDIAFDLAERMEKARRNGQAYVKLEFRHYGREAVMGGSVTEFVAAEIRRIALILRNYLPDRAAGVNTIIVVFRHEEAAVRKEIRLPGWTPPEWNQW